jgi:transposase
VAPTPELLGIRAIARHLGVPASTVHTWTKRADWPAPAATVDGRPAWTKPDVEDWSRDKLPLRTGRPPKT